MEHISNRYELIAFLIVIGFQAYTRWEVGKIAKNQELMTAQLTASRDELSRLVARTSVRIAEKTGIRRDEAVEAVEAALRVAYYQGQADAGKSTPFPAERIAAAAQKIVEISAQGDRNGNKPHKPETSEPDQHPTPPAPE